jgi:general secretion pathway protein I
MRSIEFKNCISEQGFTLLEVLVAMIILAVASAGLMAGNINVFRQQHALEIRTFATWVAENKLSELRSAHVWSDYSVNDETVAMAGYQWNLHTVITTTANSDIRKIEVAVSGDDISASSPVSLTGFIGKH